MNDRWFIIIVGNKEIKKKNKKKKSASSSSTAATMEAKILPTSVQTVNGQNIFASTTSLKRPTVSPDVVGCATAEMRRISQNVPRSPTLPPEMRRSSLSTVDSPRKSSTLMARLMGLDDIPVISPASAAEKRRKLLGALDKCDQDLNTLKQIIDAVRLVETGKVLLYEAGSSTPGSTKINNVKRSPESKRATAVVKKNSENAISLLQCEKMSTALIVGSKSGKRRKSKCGKEVEVRMNELEVWKDGIAAEMRWELGKVGAEIAHIIFKDLVEELVKEVELCFSVNGGGGPDGSRLLSGLPFHACRRRLVFS